VRFKRGGGSWYSETNSIYFTGPSLAPAAMLGSAAIADAVADASRPVLMNKDRILSERAAKRAADPEKAREY